MRYLKDWIFAILLLICTLVWIAQEPKSFDFLDLELRSLDGYLMNPPKETFILHISTHNCQSCKRDTQILMRYHVQHPSMPIVDVNLISSSEQREAIKKWKQKLDISYDVATTQKSSVLADRIPSTFVVSPAENRVLEIFGVLTYEKLLEATQKEW